MLYELKINYIFHFTHTQNCDTKDTKKKYIIQIYNLYFIF